MIVCVIPARLASGRLPRKLLLDLAGKPVIQWAWEAASSCAQFDRVIVAVDDEETKRVVEGFGGEVMMTSLRCNSGTERLVECREQIRADIWVNWQGDEPFITEKMIADLLQSVDQGGDVWTLKTPLKEEDPNAPNHVKVVCDARGRALYFSRAPIPYGGPYFKHVGLYAYSDEALGKINELPPSALEAVERLEQLRFLEGGLEIRVHETREKSIGIDVLADLEKARSHVYNGLQSAQMV